MSRLPRRTRIVNVTQIQAPSGEHLMTGADDRGGRRILCVFPRYTSSFGMFEHAYPLMGDVRALMPPQGLLVITAALPTSWKVRFVDENIEPARSEDFAWADAVFVSGMHAQRRQIEE